MRETKTIKSRRDEYTEATRQALLTAGREAFSRGGYQAAGIEAISRAARVTRGAFYHHFEDKKALFDAIVVEMQIEAAAKVEQEARRKEPIWERLFAGIEAYLDVCLEPDYARIVIQQGGAVLGSHRYQEIEGQYPLKLLSATLNALQRQGQLDAPDVELLSRMVDAMICKLAIMLPESGDPKALREQGRNIIASMLDGFRKDAP